MISSILAVNKKKKTIVYFNFNMSHYYSDARIMNVNAKYPGSTNDSFIWRQSVISTYMENLHDNGHTSYFLLGRNDNFYVYKI